VSFAPDLLCSRANSLEKMRINCRCLVLLSALELMQP
jgi:hypothetical protein